MFKRLLEKAREWLLRPTLEDLAFIHHDIQKAKLLRFGRISELENIVENLAYQLQEGKEGTCSRCDDLQADFDSYAEQFGLCMDEAEDDHPSN